MKTVRNFVATLGAGGSKVKQMIMGAGKTTVVAPLLALMLADGGSLVLSVVPKALLEMSRKQMRETFATIMCKRIYTLQFDRGTVITPRAELERLAIDLLGAGAQLAVHVLEQQPAQQVVGLRVVDVVRRDPQPGEVV